MGQNLKKILKITLILIYYLICITLFVLVTFFEPAKKILINTVEELLNLGLIGYFIIIIIGNVILILGFPITIFELVIGFTFHNLYLGFLVDILTSLSAETFCFLLSKYLIKEKIESILIKKKIFLSFKLLLEKDKWKNSFFIRLMYIPVFVKNYGIPLFDINYLIFFFTSIPTVVGFGIWRVYMGHSAKNMDSLFMKQNNVFAKVIFGITLIFTAFIIIYLFFYTRKKLKELKLANNLENKDLEINNKEKEKIEFEFQEKNNGEKKKIDENQHTNENDS